MRVDQDDKFYEGAEDLIDVDGGVENPFMTQVLLHHFDNIDQMIEDGTVDNEFDADRIFLDEEYWMYPESKKVDINDWSDEMERKGKMENGKGQTTHSDDKDKHDT